MVGRLLVAVALCVLTTAGPAGAAELAPPVAGPLLTPFDVPTPYGAGHRGVDLAAPVGTPVRAAAPGVVMFAGRVVDAVWVTVDHGTLRTTTGPMGSVVVRRGAVVDRGTVLGTSGRAHGRPALHWSARRGDQYVDPLGGRRVRATLLPDRPVRPRPPPAGVPPWPRRWVR